jgi:hypothetical protein
MFEEYLNRLSKNRHICESIKLMMVGFHNGKMAVVELGAGVGVGVGTPRDQSE